MKIQVSNRLFSTACVTVQMFGMGFAQSKCKMLLQERSGSKPKLVHVRQNWGRQIDCYLCICIPPGGRTPDELSSGEQTARLVFVNLRYLWCRCDIRLPIKDRVCRAAVRSSTLQARKTRPMRKDVRRLSASEHQCLRSIGGTIFAATQTFTIRPWALDFNHQKGK